MTADVSFGPVFVNSAYPFLILTPAHPPITRIEPDVFLTIEWSDSTCRCVPMDTLTRLVSV